MDASSSARSLRELITLYLAHAERHYRRRNGEPTREHLNLRSTLNSFANFAGDQIPPTSINRHQVRSWMHALVSQRLSRVYINSSMQRLRRFIRWSADLDYVPIYVVEELSLVRPIQPLRGGVESTPRPEISDATFAAIAKHLPDWARDVVQLLRLSAARPGELLDLTNADVIFDRRPRLTPAQHKNAHKGKTRTIPLAPAAVAIVEKYHRPLLPADRVFTTRKCPLGYSIRTLDTAWARARKKAGIADVQLYDIRRSVARRVRRSHGLDSAQALLGHSNASTTEIYAPVDASESHAFDQAARAAGVL